MSSQSLDRGRLLNCGPLGAGEADGRKRLGLIMSCEQQCSSARRSRGQRETLPEDRQTQASARLRSIEAGGSMRVLRGPFLVSRTGDEGCS